MTISLTLLTHFANESFRGLALCNSG